MFVSKMGTDAVRHVSIPKKRSAKTGEMLSMGFGFVELSTQKRLSEHFESFRAFS